MNQIEITLHHKITKKKMFWWGKWPNYYDKNNDFLIERSENYTGVRIWKLGLGSVSFFSKCSIFQLQNFVQQWRGLRALSQTLKMNCIFVTKPRSVSSSQSLFLCTNILGVWPKATMLEKWKSCSFYYWTPPLPQA